MSSLEFQKCHKSIIIHPIVLVHDPSHIMAAKIRPSDNGLQEIAVDSDTMGQAGKLQIMDDDSNSQLSRIEKNYQNIKSHFDEKRQKYKIGSEYYKHTAFGNDCQMAYFFEKAKGIKQLTLDEQLIKYKGRVVFLKILVYKFLKMNITLESFHHLISKSRQKLNYDPKFPNAANQKNFYIFTIPLLILQITNAILPTILSDNEHLLAIIVTCLAATSAAIIALENALGWVALSSSYKSVVSSFELLYNDTEILIKKLRVDMSFLSTQSNENTENFENLIHEKEEEYKYFIANSNKIEQHVIQQVPVASSFVEKLFSRKFGNLFCQETEAVESENNFDGILSELQSKKDLYHLSSEFYRKLDLCLFTSPLLLLQFFNASLPTILKEIDPSHVRLTTTIIAALSAAFIAAQAKLAFHFISAKASHIAITYHLLVSEAYFWKMKDRISSEAKIDLKKRNQNFKQFLNQMQKIEARSGKDGTLLGEFARKIVGRKMEKRKLT